MYSKIHRRALTKIIKVVSSRLVAVRKALREFERSIKYRVVRAQASHQFADSRVVRAQASQFAASNAAQIFVINPEWKALLLNVKLSDGHRFTPLLTTEVSGSSTEPYSR